MPTIVVEVQEMGERRREMIDAVVRGDQVMIRYLGETVLVLRVHSTPGEEPPAWVLETMEDAPDEFVDQPHEHEVPPFWLFN
jgi:hypothetical protein